MAVVPVDASEPASWLFVAILLLKTGPTSCEVAVAYVPGDGRGGNGVYVPTAVMRALEDLAQEHGSRQNVTIYMNEDATWLPEARYDDDDDYAQWVEGGLDERRDGLREPVPEGDNICSGSLVYALAVLRRWQLGGYGDDDGPTLRRRGDWRLKGLQFRRRLAGHDEGTRRVRIRAPGANWAGAGWAG